MSDLEAKVTLTSVELGAATNLSLYVKEVEKSDFKSGRCSYLRHRIAKKKKCLQADGNETKR